MPSKKTSEHLAITDLIQMQRQALERAEGVRDALAAEVEELGQRRHDMIREADDPDTGALKAQSLEVKAETARARRTWAEVELTDARAKVAAAQARLQALQRVESVDLNGESVSARLKSALAEQEAMLQALRNRQGELAGRVALDPGDTEALEDVALVEEQIEVAARKVSLYRQGMAAANEADAKVSKARRLVHVLDAYNEFADGMQAAVQAARDIDVYLRGLGPLVTRWREHVRAVWIAYAEVAKQDPGSSNVLFVPKETDVALGIRDVLQQTGLFDVAGGEVGPVRQFRRPEEWTTAEGAAKRTAERAHRQLVDVLGRVEV